MALNVLVTGASTGIGYSIANHLPKDTYHVFAGARKPEDLEKLNKISGVTAIKLEVTDRQDILSAAQIIAEKGGLFALVNNAGIANTATILDTPTKAQEYLFDVNVFSHLNLVKTFFEQLKNHKGKIINISSISAFIGGGGYSSTKRSVNSYSIEMASELRKFGITTSVVNPGFIKTNIFESSRKSSQEFRENSEYYSEEYKKGHEAYEQLKNANIKDPILVAKKVEQLLSSDNPPFYNVVANRNEETFTFDDMFATIVSVNKGLDNPWTKKELQELFEKKFQS